MVFIIRKVEGGADQFPLSSSQANRAAKASARKARMRVAVSMVGKVGEGAPCPLSRG
jgi:hypothetical protein